MVLLPFFLFCMELGVTITIEKDANVDERRKDIKRIREKDQKTNTCPLFGQKKKKPLALCGYLLCYVKSQINMKTSYVGINYQAKKKLIRKVIFRNIFNLFL